MFDLDRYLETRRRLVDESLDGVMPPAGDPPPLLHEAMRYSVFSGGKRLRPVLCMAAAGAAGADERTALFPGSAVELLHTYTLIHDDLPCMDDDDLRRGRPTCHVKFGEANAVLAGDALQALAFEVAARTTPPPPFPATAFVLELAAAAGSRGVVGGQVDDIGAAAGRPDAAMIETIHRRKTADLFRASVRMGAIAAGAPPARLEALTRYAVNLGLAFQITDDLLDATPEKGKKKRDKLSCLSVYAVPVAQHKARALIEDALLSLRDLPGTVEPLDALARFVLTRAS